MTAKPINYAKANTSDLLWAERDGDEKATAVLDRRRREYTARVKAAKEAAKQVCE